MLIKSHFVYTINPLGYEKDSCKIDLAFDPF